MVASEVGTGDVYCVEWGSASIEEMALVGHVPEWECHTPVWCLLHNATRTDIQQIVQITLYIYTWYAD